jgi:hypothetical protein
MLEKHRTEFKENPEAYKSLYSPVPHLCFELANYWSFLDTLTSGNFP